MTAPVLKKSLGEAGAFFDDSHGDDNLLGVMTAIVRAGVPLSAFASGAISTGVKATMIASFDGVIGNFTANVAVTGTSAATTVQVRKNGVALDTTITVDNTDADGTVATEDLSGDDEAAFVVGDIIDINVSAAPGSGTGLGATVSLQQASVQP